LHIFQRGVVAWGCARTGDGCTGINPRAIHTKPTEVG